MKTRLIDGINNKNIFEIVEEPEKVLAHFENDDKYVTLSLEQWGCYPDKKVFVLSVNYYGDSGFDFFNTWDADDSEGWNTLCYTYPHAAAAYNRYVPDEEIIPLF